MERGCSDFYNLLSVLMVRLFSFLLSYPTHIAIQRGIMPAPKKNKTGDYIFISMLCNHQAHNPAEWTGKITVGFCNA